MMGNGETFLMFSDMYDLGPGRDKSVPTETLFRAIHIADTNRFTKQSSHHRRREFGP